MSIQSDSRRSLRRCDLLTALLLAMVLSVGCQSGDQGGPATVRSADDVPIVYEVTGAGEVAVVLVHCWSCDRSYWREQIDDLARDYRVIAVDLAGHGDSGLQRQDYSIDAFAADVAAVIGELELTRVILVGHSMGGSVVIETAGLLPDKVVGLIGIDTLQEQSFGLTPTQVDGFLAPMKTDFRGQTTGFVRQMFLAGADTGLVNQIAADMASAPPEVALSAMRNLFLHDLRPTLGKLDVPIVCIDSRLHPVDTEGWAGYSGGYEVVFMDDVGHFPLREKPVAFGAELKRVIGELVAQR